MRQIARRVMILGAGALAAFAISWGTASAEEPAQGDAATFEPEFMTMMIDHHNMANEMASICQKKAVNADLKAMCNKIIADQTKEIGEMQTWLEDWYDEPHEPMMMPEDEAMLAELEALSGGPFEVRFMEMMTEHHSTAITRAQECQSKAEHDDLLELCANIITAQQAEIAQMATWQCERYQDCPNAPTPAATQPTSGPATATPRAGVISAPNTGAGSGGSGGSSPGAMALVIGLVAVGAAALGTSVRVMRRP